MGGSGQELISYVSEFICASSLSRLWQVLGALAARYRQPAGILSQEERGDQQVIRRHALDAGESVGQAAMEESSTKDETLPRRWLPF